MTSRPDARSSASPGAVPRDHSFAVALRGFSPVGLVAILVLLAGNAIVGLAFGAIYAARGRLWMLMCAHAAFDLMALALIWDVETQVAQFTFTSSGGMLFT